MMKRLIPVFALALVSFTGCGYHGVGAATHIPADVRTISVPIFQSKVQAYNTETAFTEAVVRELNTRTKYRVIPAAQGVPDATLKGVITQQTIAPLTYDPSSGQTSSYLVSITARVELVSQSGTVLYRNDTMAWHEQYQSTQDLSGFVQEDSAAMRRVARQFAEALVSDMLESFR
jgi:outer membrane lipopolysaccharide assembly protein LptE/RlpB